MALAFAVLCVCGLSAQNPTPPAPGATGAPVINARDFADASTERTVTLTGVAAVANKVYSVTIERGGSSDTYSYTAKVDDTIAAIASGLATAISGGSKYTAQADGSSAVIRLVATSLTETGALSVETPAELMTTIAATVTMKITAAMSRLRSMNSPIAEVTGEVGGRLPRRALKPPTRSLSWLRTDIGNAARAETAYRNKRTLGPDAKPNFAEPEPCSRGGAACPQAADVPPSHPQRPKQRTSRSTFQGFRFRRGD